MENTRTLSNFLSQNNVGTDNTQSFTCYLTVFAVNLAYRFPDVDLDTISYETVQEIARFSALCSSIAIAAWYDINTPQQQPQGFRRGFSSQQQKTG